MLAAAKPHDPVRWARLVSLLAYMRGDPEFVTTSVRPALDIAHQAGDFSAEAGCLYALAMASAGDSAQFERAFELAAQSGSAQFTIWSAMNAVWSVVGTESAEAKFERVASLGADYDDETFHFNVLGMRTQHAAMRGHQTEATRLARLALQHENKSLTTEWVVTAAVMLTALQGDDRELRRLADKHFGPELRELPDSQWWVQLFNAAGALAEPERPSSSLSVPSPLQFCLIASDLVARVLLTDGRLDDAVAWAKQVPTSWPAAHASAGLALAWVAVQRGDPDAAQLTHDALSEAAELGLRPFATEVLELLASQWARESSHSQVARLLGAAAATRAEMGLQWRYPYHQAAVDAAYERLREGLGGEPFEAELREGADTSLEDAVHFAEHMRPTPIAR